MKDSRRKILTVFGVLAIACPCSLCGIGYLAFRSVFAGPAEDLPNQTRLARAEGIPLTPDELRPHPPIPDEQNAATIYRAFFPHVRRAFDLDSQLTRKIGDLIRGRAKPKDAADVKAVLTAQRESLVEIAAGSRRPFCDFHYPYEKGWFVSFPEFAQGRDAARLLTAQAHLLADAGQVDEALDEVVAAQAVGSRLQQTPTLIAALVSTSVESIAITELYHCIDRSGTDARLLGRCDQMLRRFGPLADLRYAFRGEVVLGLVAVHMIRTLGDLKAIADPQTPDAPQHYEPGPTLPATVREAYESRFLSEWRKIFAALPKDRANWQEAERALGEVDRQVESDHSLTNLMNAILFPVFARAADAVGRQSARRRIAATAIRLMQDHLRSGSFPASLPDYGEISKDPFDGKPLRYRRQGDGFTLYSIDADRVDNGGVPPKGTRKGDIVRTFR